MKIVITSDTHFANDERVDNFSLKREKTYLKFLDFLVKEKIDLYIRNGDNYECWQGKGKTDRERLKLIYKRYYKSEQKLEELRKTIRTRLIPGNHDFILKHLYKLTDEMYIQTKIGKIVIMHGHQFDNQYKNAWGWAVGKIATQFWGGIEGLFGKNKTEKILDWLEKTSLKSKKSAKDLDDDEYVKRAIEFAKEFVQDIIIIGHTHKAKKVEKDGKLYLNSGTWIDGKTDYIFIDDKKDIIEIRSFE